MDIVKRILVVWFVALGGCTGTAAGDSDGAAPGGSSGSGEPKPGRGGGGGGGQAGQGPGACTPPAARIWKLTPEQYSRTLAQALPGAAGIDGEIGTSVVKRKNAYSNPADALDLSEPHVAQIFDAIGKVVDKALADPGKLSACLSTKASDPACVREVAGTVASKAFRRAIASSELDTFVAYWETQSKAGNAAGATNLMLRWILMSPDALFRTELGTGAPDGTRTVALTADERASALSFFLTDGPPDTALVEAARAGRLQTTAGMRAEAERLVKTPAVAAGVRKLLAELYGLREAPGLRKDPAVFASFTPALATDMTREVDLFVEEVLWKADARLATLLTADFSVLNGAMAAFHGVPAKADQPFQRTTLPATRRGLLTLPALMARLARENDTDPVARGKFIREVVLCQELPALPGDIDVTAPPPDGERTQRERLAAHSVGDCAGCHQKMDPLGLAFERYDGVGKYRTTEAEKTIDPSGMLTEARPGDARFADGVELVTLLAASPDVSACFVKKAFQYAHGRHETRADACALESIGRAFDGADGDVLDLMVALASDDSFVQRSLP
jgi:hypothetical protein